MRKSFAIIACLLLCGCRSFECTLPGGAKYASHTFACKQSIGTIEYTTNGIFRVVNYNMDQVAGVQAIAQGVVQGMIQGGAAAVKP